MIPCTKPLIRNRSDCALDPTLALGLNSTWSFAQGWRGPGIKSGAKCVNCARVVPQAEDPLFNRRAWRHADQSRPKADQLKCYNCHYYFEINGRERPARLETSRAADSQEFKTKNRSGRTPPPICEHTGCSGPIYRWYPPHSKYYCPLHRDRAIKGTDMDAEPVVRAKKSKRDRDRPDTCEAEDRDETTIKYVGPSKQFYCRAHGHRARAGKKQRSSILPLMPSGIAQHTRDVQQMGKIWMLRLHTGNQGAVKDHSETQICRSSVDRIQLGLCGFLIGLM
ncbi:hypothetical protein EKO04_000894 [Ascochyta lentis]|uniref:Uncharacterized protein n=1 Tax=Ascochyta lentis TaxID=205686 RepID=A0A8H7MM49_9PLEO|nr:hypothetical protein EKO04_000894 [Ascochyta lentis]